MSETTDTSVSAAPSKVTRWTRTLDYPFAVREDVREVDGKAVRTLRRVELDEAQDGDRVVKSISFRRMRAGDPKRTEGIENQYQSSLVILATLSDEPVEVLDMVDIDDFEEINEGVQPLLGKSAMKLAQALATAQGEVAPPEETSSGAT